MAPPQDNQKLLIRCPSCGQRFKVGVELKDRTVECGACEHRFRINDDVIVRSRKFYPGERPEELVNRFNRVPIVAPVPEGLQTAHYSDVADSSSFEPVSPLRMVAGGGAAALVVLVAMLLFFGAANGGALDGMPTSNRLVMAGFAALISSALFIYANPRKRMPAAMVSLACTAVLMTLPLVRTEGSTPPIAAPERDPFERGSKPAREVSADEVAQLRARINTDPLVKEAKILSEGGSGLKAYGLWLRGLGDGEKLLVRDYLVRTLGADPSTHAYPRGTGEYLMVVSGLRGSLDDLADAVEAIGEIVQVFSEIDVIEVKVNAEIFEAPPIEQLADRESPRFYESNRRELESIDIERVKGAVERLAAVEPKMFRSDIARRLVKLLGEQGVDFKGLVCDALMVWADESAPAGEAAEALLRRLDASKSVIPVQLGALLAREKRVGAIEIIERQWLEDITRWERTLIDFGPAVEKPLLERLPGLNGVVRGSAINILGQVGGQESLQALDEIRSSGKAQEHSVRIENAIREIRRRLGQ